MCLFTLGFLGVGGVVVVFWCFFMSLSGNRSRPLDIQYTTIYVLYEGSFTGT